MPVAGIPVDANNIHSFRDFLSLYNKATEYCFVRCASNFNGRNLTVDEGTCVDRCCGKFMNGSQHVMMTFAEIQTQRQQRLMEEAVAAQQQQSQTQTIESPVTPPS